MTSVLIKGNVYRLSSIPKRMWAFPHPRYGRPSTFIATFGGTLVMRRTWHAFEIYVHDVYGDAVFIPQEDMDRISIEDLGPHSRGI